MFAKDIGEIEQGGERWALFTALQLADIIPVVSSLMGQRLLRVSMLLPQLPENHTKRHFGIESPSLPAGCWGQVRNCPRRAIFVSAGHCLLRLQTVPNLLPHSTFCYPFCNPRRPGFIRTRFAATASASGRPPHGSTRQWYDRAGGPAIDYPRMLKSNYPSSLSRRSCPAQERVLYLDLLTD